MLKLFLIAALRSAKKRWIASTAVVITLGVCIACAGIAFGLLEGTIIKKLGVPDEDRVVAVTSSLQGGSFSYPNYLSYRESTESLSGMVAFWSDRQMVLQRGDHFDYLRCDFVSPNYFETLHPRMLVGSYFTEDPQNDAANGDVAVISYRMWRDLFDSDRNIVGKQITLNSIGFTVLGIVDEGFRGCDVSRPSDLWVPVTSIRISQHAYFTQSRGYSAFRIFGRLKEGVSIAQANSELETVARNVELEFSDTPYSREDLVEVYTGADYAKVQNKSLYRLYILLILVAAFLLLIATANVVNVFLSSIVERRGELALRSCIGATRWQILCQFWVESAVTTLGGAFVGVALIAIFQLTVAESYGLAAMAINYRTVGFFAGLVILLMGGLSLIPFLYISRMNLSMDAREVRTGTFRNKTQKGLLLFQIMITTVLLIIFLYFGKSLEQVRSTDFGFSKSNVVLLNVNVKSKRWRLDPAWPYFHNLKRELESIPGAGLTHYPPAATSLAEKKLSDSILCCTFDLRFALRLGCLIIPISLSSSIPSLIRDGSICAFIL